MVIPHRGHHLHALWQHEAILRGLHRSFETYTAAGQVFSHVEPSSLSKILGSEDEIFLYLHADWQPIYSISLFIIYIYIVYVYKYLCKFYIYAKMNMLYLVIRLILPTQLSNLYV